MNISPWIIYWITRADIITNSLTFMAVCASVAAIFTWGLYLINKVEIEKGKEEENNIEYRISRKLAHVSLFLSIIFILLSMFLPNSKTLTAMYVIPKIANNETVTKILQDTPDKAYKVLDKYLDNQLYKLENEVNTQKGEMK